MRTVILLYKISHSFTFCRAVGVPNCFVNHHFSFVLEALIIAVICTDDAACVNDAGNISKAGKNDVQEKLARASVLPKHSKWWNDPGAAQTTTLVATSSGAIGISGHDEIGMFVWNEKEKVVMESKFTGIENKSTKEQ